MIDNPFRALLPRYVEPLLSLYASLGLSPNAVTWIGFGLAGMSAFLVVADAPVAAVGVWWLGRLADGTDGIYARATARESGFGAYLDILLDMASYGVMVVAFDWVHPELHAAWVAMLFLYVLCITSALALGMQQAALDQPRSDDRGLRLGAGLAEGGETGLAYTAFLLFPAYLPTLTAIWVAILSLTVVARTLLAWRLLTR